MPCQFVRRESELAISGGAPVSGGYYPLYTYAQTGGQQQRPLSPRLHQMSQSPLEGDPLYPLDRLQYPFGPTRQGHYPMATFVNRSQSNSRNASRAATPNPHSHSHNSGNSHAVLGRKGSAGAGAPAEGPSGAGGLGLYAPLGAVPAPIEVVVTSSGCAEQEKASQGTNSSNGSSALAALGALQEPFASQCDAAAIATVFPLPSLAGVPTLPPLPPVPALPGASSAVIGRRPITPRQNADSLVHLQTHSHPQAAYSAATGRPPVAPKPVAAAAEGVQSPLPTESSASVLDEAHTASCNGSAPRGMSKWFDRLNAASQV